MPPGWCWTWLGTLGPQFTRGYWQVQRKRGRTWITTHGSFFCANATTILKYMKGAGRVLTPPDRDGNRHVAMTKRR